MLNTVEKTKTCKVCGKPFLPAMYKQSSLYCENPECQRAKLHRARNYRKSNQARSAPLRQGAGEKPPLRKAGSGRPCRKCGKDAYPNYFYCPICHKSINQDDEYGSAGLEY